MKLLKVVPLSFLLELGGRHQTKIFLLILILTSMILNLHRLDTSNIGDIFCAPYHYAHWLRGSEAVDILSFYRAQRSRPPESVARDFPRIVVGGGGLIDIEFFQPSIDFLLSLTQFGSKIVFWGVGHNEWKIADWRKLKHRYRQVFPEGVLIGTRDFNSGFPWCPCVSCLSPHFDKPVSDISHPTSVYLHTGSVERRLHENRVFSGLPILANDAPLEQVISFISKTDLLLTDSFHGAYWGILLGKRVIAFPSSSKFYSLKHPVPLCDPEDWRNHVGLTNIYNGALEECRLRNQKFSHLALEFLKV